MDKDMGSVPDTAGDRSKRRIDTLYIEPKTFDQFYGLMEPNHRRPTNASGTGKKRALTDSQQTRNRTSKRPKAGSSTQQHSMDHLGEDNENE